MTVDLGCEGRSKSWHVRSGSDQMLVNSAEQGGVKRKLPVLLFDVMVSF